jgi:hypothetical protein
MINSGTLNITRTHIVSWGKQTILHSNLTFERCRIIKKKTYQNKCILYIMMVEISIRNNNKMKDLCTYNFGRRAIIQISK